MIKSVCKTIFILGFGSLTLAHAALLNLSSLPAPTAGNGGIDMYSGSPATNSLDYKTYLNFTGVGAQTLKLEKSVAASAPTVYFALNEALVAEQLQNLIGNQMKIISQLGVMTMPSWQSVDTSTYSLMKSMSGVDPFMAALTAQHSDYKLSRVGTGSVSPTSIEMDTYIANLAVMANQNEAAILARLQSCMSQGSLKQCGSAQS